MVLRKLYFYLFIFCFGLLGSVVANGNDKQTNSSTTTEANEISQKINESTNFASPVFSSTGESVSSKNSTKIWFTTEIVGTQTNKFDESSTEIGSTESSDKKASITTRTSPYSTSPKAGLKEGEIAVIIVITISVLFISFIIFVMVVTFCCRRKPTKESHDIIPVVAEEDSFSQDHEDPSFDMEAWFDLESARSTSRIGRRKSQKSFKNVGKRSIRKENIESPPKRKSVRRPSVSPSPGTSSSSSEGEQMKKAWRDVHK